MNRRDAKALGKWCTEHNRKHERVHFPAGGASTMCHDCAREPEFAMAMDEMIRLVMQHEMEKGDSSE